VTIVVGFSPEKGGRATLELAVLLARSGRAEPLVVTTATPPALDDPVHGQGGRRVPGLGDRAG